MDENNEKNSIKEILKKIIGDRKTILKIEADSEGGADVNVEGTPISLLAAFATLTNGLFKSLQEHGIPKSIASQMMLKAYSDGMSRIDDDDEEEGEE